MGQAGLIVDRSGGTHEANKRCLDLLRDGGRTTDERTNWSGIRASVRRF